MITEEELLRLKSINESRQARGRDKGRDGQFVPGARAVENTLKSIAGAGPVKGPARWITDKFKEGFHQWAQGPRAGTTEAIQRHGEFREATDPTGFLERIDPSEELQYVGREYLSDILDVSSDVTKGIIPESWGERMDPSGDTELGAAFEAEKQKFRKREGADPSLLQQYDMKTSLQDEAMPWLKERHNVGPLEFSNRALVELGGEGAAVLAEIATIGGAASAGAKFAARGKMLSDKLLKAQSGKGPVSGAAGRVEAVGIRAGSEVIKQVLTTPRYFDKAFSYVLGKGVGWPVRQALRIPGFPLKLTAGGIKMFMNYLRDDAIQHGASRVDADAYLMKSVQDLGAANTLSDEAKMALRSDGFKVFDEGYQPPLTSVEDTAATAQRVERMAAQYGPEGMPGKAEYDALGTPINTKEGQEFFHNIHMSKMEIERNSRIEIMKDIWVYDEATLPVFPVMDKIMKMTADQFAYLKARGLKETLRKYKQELTWAYESIPIPESLQKKWGGRKTLRAGDPESRAEIRLEREEGLWAGGAGKSELTWKSIAEDRKESAVAMSMSKVAYYTKELIAAGVLQVRVGGKLVESATKAVKVADDDLKRRPESGDLYQNIVEKFKGMSEVNYSWKMPDDFYDDTINFKGYTEITYDYGLNRPAHYIDNRGNPLGKVHWERRLDANYNPVGDKPSDYFYVADDLDPGFGDVIQKLGHYEQPLKAIKNVLKRLDENGEVIPDEWASAWDVALLIKKEAEKMEGLLRMAGSDLPGKSSVSAGGVHFPRNVLEGTITSTGGIPNKKSVFELNIPEDAGVRSPKDPHSQLRRYASEGEGMLNRHIYLDPATAMTDYTTYAYNVAIESLEERWLKQVAEKHGVSTSVKRFVGDAEYEMMRGSYLGDIEKALQAITKRHQAAKTAASKRVFKEAEKLLNGVSKLRTVNFVNYDLKSIELVDAAKRDLDDTIAKINNWNDNAKLIAEELRVTASEKKRLNKALKRARDAFNEYKKAKYEDFKSIGGLGTEDVTFPKAFAEAFLKASKQHGADPKDYNLVLRLNSWMRLAGATGDMSAFGIQGSVQAMNDAFDALVGKKVPKFNPETGMFDMRVPSSATSMIAMKASWTALRNSGAEIVGEMMYRKEQIALRTGGPSPSMLANEGLAILQNAPDLYFSKGIRNLPGIRNFDSAFTHYGNILRLEMAEAEVLMEMAKGKTLKQLIDDGTVRQISSVANFMSGVGKRGYMGNVGQFIFFAPRFFQARLKMTTLAAGGMLPGSRPLEQRLAAQYMSRMFGTSAYLTFMLNEALGEETDINPVRRSPKTGLIVMNPNFMRVHAGPIDFTFLGPWDGFFRLMATIPLALINTKDRVESVRTIISAPGTSAVITTLTGEDAIGQKSAFARVNLEDAGPSEYFNQFGTLVLDVLTEHFTPFAWDELVSPMPGQPGVTRRAFEGAKELGIEQRGFKAVPGENPGAGAVKIAAAVGQTAAQFLGVKSSYETVSETMNEAYADILENMTRDQRLQVFNAGPVGGSSTKTMTSEEVDAIWAQGGENWWDRFIDIGDDWSVSVKFRGGLGAHVPKWEDIASDAKDRIKEMIAQGKFARWMTPQELIELEKRIEVRRQNSASDYAKLGIARTEIETSEIAMLREAEDGWLSIQDDADAPGFYVSVVEEGGLKPKLGKDGEKQLKYITRGDVQKYLDHVKEIRAYHSNLKRGLVNKGGEFYGVVEALFPDMDRSYSDWDVDIYDFAQSSYYEDFYGPSKTEEGETLPSISDPISGVDWDMKDRKIEQWNKKMKKNFPHLDDGQLKRYLWRIENSMKRDAPPVASAMMEMQTVLSRTKLLNGRTLYDLDLESVKRVVAASEGKSYADVLNWYRRWKQAETPQSRDSITRLAVKNGVKLGALGAFEKWSRHRRDLIDAYFERRDPAYAKLRGAAREQEKLKRDRIEGIMLFLGQRNKPTGKYAWKIGQILSDHSHGTFTIDNMAQFVHTILEGDSVDEFDKRAKRKLANRTAA